MDSSVIAFAKSQTLAVAEARKLELNDPLVVEGALPVIQRSESPLFSPQPFVAESTNDTFLEAETCPYDYNDFEDDDEFDMTMNMEQFNHDDQYNDSGDSRDSRDSTVPMPSTERTGSLSHLESDLSQLKINLASRFCYYMTASSSQILVLFYQFIGLISDHVAVIVADLLTEYFNCLRNRFKKLLATKQLDVSEVEGRVSEGSMFDEQNAEVEKDHKVRFIQIRSDSDYLYSFEYWIRNRPVIKELRRLFQSHFKVKNNEEIKDDSFTCFISEVYTRNNKPIEDHCFGMINE